MTVVPAADRDAVLAAFGAMSGTSRVGGSPDDVDSGTTGVESIYVVEISEAVVVIEDNGYQGSRSEVLRPASKASGTGVASSFFWNVNAVTAFSAARRGRPLFSVELIGAEDDELDGVPKALRKLVVAGGSEGGDLLGAGLALIAAFAKTSFSHDDLQGGTVYEIEPPPADLRTYGPGYRYTYGMPDAASMLASLSAEQQRRFAAWATRAAAREAAVEDEAAARSVLDQLAMGEPLRTPPSLDVLVRATVTGHKHFTDLEDDVETGGVPIPTDHPYYEAPGDRGFGTTRGFSHLEGCYLGQRRFAVEAVRYVVHPDPLSAAIACAGAASTTFWLGRLTRDWTFIDNERGRWQSDTLPNPRHEQFLQAAALLMQDLRGPGPVDDAIARADAALPAPLTATQRTEAIRADALAAAQGAFATYQVSRGPHSPGPIAACPDVDACAAHDVGAWADGRALTVATEPRSLHRAGSRGVAGCHGRLAVGRTRDCSLVWPRGLRLDLEEPGPVHRRRVALPRGIRLDLTSPLAEDGVLISADTRASRQMRKLCFSAGTRRVDPYSRASTALRICREAASASTVTVSTTRSAAGRSQSSANWKTSTCLCRQRADASRLLIISVDPGVQCFRVSVEQHMEDLVVPVCDPGDDFAPVVRN
ncbi:hypothetical protein ASG88_19540 [Nocardioides sp. Soil777]|nr:hypothetical protein ASG88_19540 [Nocardioides sp. Soil777]